MVGCAKHRPLAYVAAQAETVSKLDAGNNLRFNLRPDETIWFEIRRAETSGQKHNRLDPNPF